MGYPKEYFRVIFTVFVAIMLKYHKYSMAYDYLFVKLAKLLGIDSELRNQACDLKDPKYNMFKVGYLQSVKILI